MEFARRRTGEAPLRIVSSDERSFATDAASTAALEMPRSRSVLREETDETTAADSTMKRSKAAWSASISRAVAADWATAGLSASRPRLACCSMPE